jgi:threonine/homoserine/homoserine lactone efflux protein
MWRIFVINSILYGMSLGLSAGMAPGPTLAGVIHESSLGRLKKALLISITPLITDPPIIFLGYYFFNKIGLHNKFFLIAIQVIGILILLKLAISLFIKSNKIKGTEVSLQNAILLNLTNPGPYVFWWTIGCPWLSSQSNSGLERLMFLMVFFISIIGIKIFFALLLSTISNKFISIHDQLSRFFGIALLFFAIFSSVEVIKNVF